MEVWVLFQIAKINQNKVIITIKPVIIFFARGESSLQFLKNATCAEPIDAKCNKTRDLNDKPQLHKIIIIPPPLKGGHASSGPSTSRFGFWFFLRTRS